MKNKIKRGLKKIKFKKGFFNQQWVITLTSTMLGVIFGLFVSDYYSHNKNINSKEKALLEVKSEIIKNNNILKIYHDTLSVKYNYFEYLSSKINTDFQIVIHKDSLLNFKSKTKNIFKYNNFETLSDSLYSIKGDFNLNINSRLLFNDLSSIIWNSYKQTDYLKLTKFTCLTDIEGLYELQNETNQLNREWRKEVINGNFITKKENLNAFLLKWKAVLINQDILLQYYNFENGIFKECE